MANDSSPVPCIGLYIAGASFLYLLLMLYDVIVAGVLASNRWLPRKRFTLNSFTLALLSVAAKHDLSTPMPSFQDQLSMLTVTIIICMSMGFFLPSLVANTDFECFTNMVALSIFVVTVAVNISIQLYTGVIVLFYEEHIIVLGMMLLLLLMLWHAFWHVKTHQIITSDKYRNLFLKGRRSMFDRLKLPYLYAYCKNPQFDISMHNAAVSPICLVCSIILLKATLRGLVLKPLHFSGGKSDYKWSVLFILITQILTIVVGTVAIMFRWLALFPGMELDIVLISFKEEDDHVIQRNKTMSKGLRTTLRRLWLPSASLNNARPMDISSVDETVKLLMNELSVLMRITPERGEDESSRWSKILEGQEIEVHSLWDRFYELRNGPTPNNMNAEYELHKEVKQLTKYLKGLHECVKLEGSQRELAAQKPKIYLREELESFTANLSIQIASGGFAKVYKGQFPDGIAVAVKVLEENDDVQDMFMAELSTMCRTSHPYLVKLYGYCFTQKMKALVYDFMEKGSFDKVLYYNPHGLDWKKFYEIAINIAEGLSYLHHDCPETIIHYDVKPANVLIDANLSPKIIDFGLSKFMNKDLTHRTNTGMKGTAIFVAPEVVIPWSPVSSKCDVYSFGMLLFEIVGMKPIDGDKGWFPTQLWEKLKDGKLYKTLEACGISEKYSEEAEILSVVALWCVQFKPTARPSMREVVKMLKKELVLQSPPHPLFAESWTPTMQEEVYPNSSAFLHFSEPSVPAIKEVYPKLSPSRSGERLNEKILPQKEGTSNSKEFTSLVLEPPQKSNVDVSAPYNNVSVGSLQNVPTNIHQYVAIGPWGGPGGDDWTVNKRGRGIIKQIVVSWGSHYEAFSLKFKIEVNGVAKYTEDFGAPGRYSKNIDFRPNEYLTRISGHEGYTSAKDHLIIRSLTFSTNMKDYGVYFTSPTGGTYFTSPTGKIVGFFGRKGSLLDAVGVFMESNLN